MRVKSFKLPFTTKTGNVIVAAIHCFWDPLWKPTSLQNPSSVEYATRKYVVNPLTMIVGIVGHKSVMDVEK
jgi:hypothetical protein